MEFKYPQSCKVNEGSIFVELLFRCPAIHPDKVQTRNQWKTEILKLTNDLKKMDPLHAALIELKSFNHKSRMDKCVEALSNYLDKIAEFPRVEANKSLEVESKLFKENVSPAEGALDFLASVGFERVLRNNKPFYVFQEYLYPVSDLRFVIHLLRNLKGYDFLLDRDCKIFTFTQTESDVFLSRDFYEIRPEDVAIEEQLRKFQLESQLGLTTRNLYKRLRNDKKALYTRLEVRLPGGDSVQGTFASDERLADVRTFLDGIVEVGKKYCLTSIELFLTRNAEEKTLEELDLVPTGYVQLQFPTDKRKNVKEIE